ncbi:unnamed protein product, partial [Mesorhabditis belari]|uniref:Lipase n=1 Tax=Mesorhabditis belari TaxID=2138241 RepID=A0AAF3JBC5_9BILA
MSRRFLFFVYFCVIYADVNGPLTDDFTNWLNSNNYISDNFTRTDYKTKGSYGGKSKANPVTTKTPVIFIHGNSDSALHSSATATGWDNTIAYFLARNYTTADLYATSWGDSNALNADTRTHNCKEVLRLRRFMEAVLKYTGAPKVSFITHSMGVTLGRKIIKGGKISASDGNCDVGAPLTKNVDVFVGLSGANYGLCTCEASGVSIATCNKDDGLWPGDTCGFNMYVCAENPLMFPCSGPTYSKFLTTLNTDTTREGSYVFSAWSVADDVILGGDMVWGRPTSLIPTSNDHKTYLSYGHMATKELTADDQYGMVVNKKIPQSTGHTLLQDGKKQIERSPRFVRSSFLT